MRRYLVPILLLTLLNSFVAYALSVSPACDNTGATDATACLQHLFNMSGPIVEIPAGTFLAGCRTPLLLPSNKTIRGRGRDVTTILGCNGLQFPIVAWTYASGVLTVTTAQPVLPQLTTAYCPLNRDGVTCTLAFVNGHLAEGVDHYLFSGGGLSGVRTSTAGPTFTSVKSKTFTIPISGAHTAAPKASSGIGGIFTIPMPPIMAANDQAGTLSTNVTLKDMTLSGGCAPTQPCASARGPFSEYLLDLNSHDASHYASNAVIQNVVFRDTAGTGLSASGADGLKVSHVKFINMGLQAVGGHCPSNVSFSHLLVNWGWSADPRIDLADSAGGLSFEACPGSNMAVTDSIFDPFGGRANFEAFAFGIFPVEDGPTATANLYSGITFTGNTMIWEGSSRGGIVSAFADHMTLTKNRVTGNCPTTVPCGFAELSGSYIQASLNDGLWFAVGFGRARPHSGAHVSIHHNNYSTRASSNGNGYSMIQIFGDNTFGSASWDDIKIDHNHMTCMYDNASNGGFQMIVLGAGDGTTTPVTMTNASVDHNVLDIFGKKIGTQIDTFLTIYTKGPSRGLRIHDNVSRGSANHIDFTPGSTFADTQISNETHDSPVTVTNNSGGAQPR